MKKLCLILMFAALLRSDVVRAQTIAGSYASDVNVIIDAQKQALEQAHKALGQGGTETARAALITAVKDMERSQSALQDALKSPDKLPVAVAAAQSAYQALLKATPREYRMSRSRQGGQGSGGGQPGQEEMNQLELTSDDNRYQTEQQAQAAPSAQQREQSENLDRLKQLARRQQDLNDRLRDLQTALQEAKTESEREDIQRQLKRLRDEERELLSNVDEMRQNMEQSPNAAQQSQQRQQLEQTRNDVQRAAQELENQSVSQALAAGSRAEEKMQDLRENLRQQSSSQFTRQMRDLRNQTHDLAAHEDQIAQDLEKMNNSTEKSLGDSAQRQSLVDQLAQQQSALTNLLDQMRTVTEQAENTEPLLSKQLYDTVRHTEQSHADNQLQMSSQLVDRGFLPQAAESEKSARENIDELKQNVDRAADSVLGSEADALKYAQKQLDDLSNELTRDLTHRTNGSSASGQRGSQTQNGSGETNGPSSTAGNSDRSQNPAQSGGKSNGQQAANGQQGQKGEVASNSQNGQPGNSANPNSNSGSQPRPNSQQPGNQQGRNGDGDSASNSQQSNPGDASSSSQQDQSQSGAQGGNGGPDDLRRFAQQLGSTGGAGGLSENGPITGNNFVDWSDRMRDVEQSVNSQDIRNQLATVRERIGVYRRNFRQSGILPPPGELQNKALEPLALARDWVGQELARSQNDHSLVPLDRDPVQDKYSDLVRKYYEKLGSAQ